MRGEGLSPNRPAENETYICSSGGRFERTFFDVRVFNPFASSNQSSSISATYVRHEKAKKRSYEERLREIEHASFVPLVFSTTGGMGKQSASLYKRIASLIAEKSGEPYSVVMSFIRCRLSFALLRASVMCLRGSRSVFAVQASLCVSEHSSDANANPANYLLFIMHLSLLLPPLL